ncbi:MAG TPA: hypothetical protein VGC76_07605 [Pyrinomonadaceae bacterium]|jgi:hypothetical protein
MDKNVYIGAIFITVLIFYVISLWAKGDGYRLLSWSVLLLGLLAFLRNLAATNSISPSFSLLALIIACLTFLIIAIRAIYRLKTNPDVAVWRMTSSKFSYSDWKYHEKYRLTDVGGEYLTHFWIGQTIISLVYLAISLLLFIKVPEWLDK